jgi:hypothetical protein
MSSFSQFLQWEKATQDVLDFKKIYVDVAGDVMAGLMLSELVYWHLPSKEGKSRLRVKHEGRYWVASRRYEWWDRCRFKPRQADRAAKILIERGLVEKRIFKFCGETTAHFAINEAAFLQAWNAALESPAVNPFAPKGAAEGDTVGASQNRNESPIGEADLPVRESGSTRTGIPLTETTSENTTEDNNTLAANAEESLAHSRTLEEPPEEEALRDVQTAFAQYCGLTDIPSPGDSRYSDWRKSYKELAGIAARNGIEPGLLALSCAAKRAEQGFSAGRPGAFLKTAENVAAAWSDPAQQTSMKWQVKLYYQEHVGGSDA